MLFKFQRGLQTRLKSSVTLSNPLFDKILIANRGEIACRVMRTAKKLGVKTVAVYSEPDSGSMHVQMADEAYLIGPAASSDSYLRMDKIIAVAQRTNAKAIHPGYGFLSENPVFAKQVEEAGLAFIGPPASAIIAMGSKSASKQIMQKANVPVVPGYHGQDQSSELLKQEATKMGYPVLIKAVKGGGGKGMRIVQSVDEFDLMLESAKREASKSFGDDKVLVEKYITRPRHVEVQIFCDKHGNAVYLFERDCSVQRRHQKILEEAPAPGLSEDLRQSLGAKAVAAAKAVNYVGAGTVEFILDTETNQFYFMEMNTRLQVEHPVTEMITDTDLVEWQLRVASGSTLPKNQQDLAIVGHAFEARIYAENPAKNFLPDTGHLVHMKTPEPTSSVRIETGVKQGDDVSVFYDPMISKLVVHAQDRTEALRVLRKALGEFEVVGPNTNIEFLKSLSSHPAFIEADVETGFIKRHEEALFKQNNELDAIVHAQAALFLIHRVAQLVSRSDSATPWTNLSGFRLNHKASHELVFLDSKESKQSTKVLVEYSPDGQYSISVSKNGSETVFEKAFVSNTLEENTLNGQIGDQRIQSRLILQNDTSLDIFFNGNRYQLFMPKPEHLSLDGGHDLGSSVVTPMPCKISQVMVKNGDTVKAGQPLVILEAMKMEHVIKSPKDAVIKKVLYKAGDLVGDGKQLLTFEEAEK